jgi:hypothetical protein
MEGHRMSRDEGTPLTRQDYHLAEDIFREAVEANLADEDNLEAIRDTFEHRVGQAFQRGSFVVEVERLISDHLWARVNGRAGQTTLAMVKEIVSGQIGIDYDAWLDQVITVGKHRRTTIRNMVGNDWTRIIAVRQENADRAAEALDLTRRAASISLPAMKQHGGMAKAAATFVHPPKTAAS